MLNFGVFSSRSQMPNCPQERLSWFTLPLAGCESSYFLFSILLKRKTICIWYQHSFFFFLTFANSSGKHTILICMSLMTSEVGHFSVCLFFYLYFFFWICTACSCHLPSFQIRWVFFFWWHLLYLYVLYTSCKYFYQFLIHILLWWFKNFCLFHFSLWCYDKLL